MSPSRGLPPRHAGAWTPPHTARGTHSDVHTNVHTHIRGLQARHAGAWTPCRVTVLVQWFPNVDVVINSHGPPAARGPSVARAPQVGRFAIMYAHTCLTGRPLTSLQISFRQRSVDRPVFQPPQQPPGKVALRSEVMLGCPSALR